MNKTPTPGSAPPTDTSDLQPRSTLGPYTLTEKLGQGGMGTVYKAWHGLLKRIVALKLLPADRLHDPQAVARFYREMEAIGKIDHPHIVRATDAGDDQGQPYLAMDYIEGLTLAELVHAGGPLPVADACELARQTALALECLRQNGLVHRDIKPSNLLLSAAGQLKVLDLGLAALYAEQPDHERLTTTGMVLGTGDYMAPEQGMGSRDVDIRADLYSLGCTLYKLLTGKAPFADPSFGTYYQKIKAHAETPVPPAEALRPGLPAELLAVLRRLLAKAPDDRYALPLEVASALEPFTAGHDLAGLLATARVRHGAPHVDTSRETTPHRCSTPGYGLPASASGSSLGGSTPREQSQQPTKRARSLLLLAGAVGVVAACFLAVLHGLGDRETPPVPPPKAAVLRVDNLQPGKWHDLLGQEPEALCWPAEAPHARREFNPAKPFFWVECPNPTLFTLGEAENATFELELTLHQNRWIGGVGVFFGGHFVHDHPRTKEPVLRYQLLRVDATPPGTPNKHLFHINRSVVEVVPPQHSVGIDGGVALSAGIPPPAGPHKLRLIVGPAALEHVWWDDKARDGLTVLISPNAVKPRDNRGLFGIYFNDVATTLSSARVKLLPRSPDGRK